MFSMAKNCGLVDYAVSRAMRELNADTERITAQRIADHIGSNRVTVARSMRRLMAAEIIIRLEGSAREGGYRYALN